MLPYSVADVCVWLDSRALTSHGAPCASPRTPYELVGGGAVTTTTASKGEATDEDHYSIVHRRTTR